MGTNKHLAMKSVSSALCIFLALLSTASAAGTSVLTQKVTISGLTTAKFTGKDKKLIEGGYLYANLWVDRTTTDGVVKPLTGITYTATASATVVTFVVTQGSTFTGTKKTIATLASKSAVGTGVASWGALQGNTLDGNSFAANPATMDVSAVAAGTTAAPTAAPANATSSASGGVQFSQIALSIPVVAMVISKIC